jgi:hypothetical protein
MVELSLKQDGNVDYTNDVWDEGLTPIIGFPPGQHRLVLVKDAEGKMNTSPMPQEFDYNSGWMILQTPLSMNGLDLASHSKFAFRVVETNPKTDVETRTDWIRIDLARLPLRYSLSGPLGPASPSATIRFKVADPTGYVYANPSGLLVLDPTGAPGVGQAYPLLFKFDQPFVTFFSFIARSD